MEHSSYIDIECPCGKQYKILTGEKSTAPAKIVCRCGRLLEVYWGAEKEELNERRKATESKKNH